MEAYSVIRGEGNMQMAFISKGLDREIGNLPNSTDPLVGRIRSWINQ